MKEIYHIRLNTGEDLISEVIWPKTKPGSESHIMLVKPMKILCLPSNKPGFVSLSLMQWIFTKISEEQEFNIFSRDILTMSNPNPTLREYYTETVDFFDRKSNPIDSYLEELEREIEAVEESDRAVEDMPEIDQIVSDFLNSLSANNKGTLH